MKRIFEIKDMVPVVAAHDQTLAMAQQAMLTLVEDPNGVDQLWKLINIQFKKAEKQEQMPRMALAVFATLGIIVTVKAIMEATDCHD